MDKLTFRNALPQDGDSILRIYNYSIEHEDATYITICPTWEEWDEAHDDEQRIVAIINEQVIGFVAVTGEGENGIVSVYVDKDYRRLGIGSMLLQCLITYNVYQAKKKRKRYLSLHSKIFTNNTASILLHEKAGFVRIGCYQKSLNKNGIWRDVYVYERRIRIV